MEIEDRVYGKVEITEPVLLELINSKPVQRVKGVSQYVPNGPWGYPFKGFSRFDHCLGVMILLKKLNASLNEQIAGLLHDISHLAFSHVADWALGHQEGEGFHDTIFEKVILDSEIPEILKRNNIDTKEILDLDKFFLLEQPSPALCADRVDYALRELAHTYGEKEIEDSKELVKEIINFQGKIAFKTKDAALKFGNYFLDFQTNHWGRKDTVVYFKIFSDTLKAAIAAKELSMEDLSKTDEHVVNILKNSKDPKVLESMSLLKKGFTIKETENPSFSEIKKFRYVNPTYLEDGKLLSLEESDESYREAVKKHKEINQKGINVDIIPN